MKVDIEDPKAVLEDILTRINNGEYVKVVRCKDCKWSKPYRTESGNVFFACIEAGVYSLRADDYCSYGERKEKTDERKV